MIQPEFSIGHLVALAAMTGKAYRFVKLSGETQLALCGAGENGLGVLQDEPLAAQPGNIMAVGISLVVAGAAFEANVPLKSDALGRAIEASETDEFVFGIALEEATAAGDQIQILLLGGNLARQLQNTVVLQSVVPAYGQAVDGTTPVFRVPFDATVQSVNFVPTSLLTGADTNSRTLKVINKAQNGAGATEIAAKAFTNGTNAPAFDETAITLSGTPANLNVSEGDILAWNSDSIGTGLADPGGLLLVKITRRAS